MTDILMRVIPAAAVLLILALIFLLGYVKAPPDQAYIISGLKKELARIPEPVEALTNSELEEILQLRNFWMKTVCCTCGARSRRWRAARWTRRRARA